MNVYTMHDEFKKLNIWQFRKKYKMASDEHAKEQSGERGNSYVNKLFNRSKT